MKDFYSYVNKDWLEKTIIPDGHSHWGTFAILEENNKKMVKDLLEKSDNIASIIYKQFFTKNSKEDLFIVQRIFYNIDIQTNKNNLFNYMFLLHITFNIKFCLSVDISSDLDNANFNILHIDSSGLGLPDRDYYFLDNKKDIRDKYKIFIENYSKLFNQIIDVNNIYNIEKLLASNIYTKVENRQPELLNNPIFFDHYIKKYNNLSFIKIIFDKINITPNKMNILNPKFMNYLNNLIDTISLDKWKEYFKFKVMCSFNKYLTFKIEKCYFDFYGKIINGIKTMKNNKDRSIEITKNLLGDVIGKMYVEKYFNSDSKSTVENMVNSIKNELRIILKNNDWMEESTKEKALVKLDKMNMKIGFPDVPVPDKYSNININSNNPYLKNILLIKKANFLYEASFLYKPLDKSRWFMPSHEVNAYYSPSYNEIVFPAGILQPPMFSLYQDVGSNFGGIGTIIGHEITHGFDDQGSKFDGDGNLKNWWSDNDRIKYDKKTQIIKEQYAKYHIEGENVNGELTLGENIADIGGVKLSLNALKRLRLGKYYIKDFFINYANIWKIKYHKEKILEKLITDPHSPNIFRVNGVVYNINDFYNTFNIENKISNYDVIW
jgi:predicted metalloendopeptidase